MANSHAHTALFIVMVRLQCGVENALSDVLADCTYDQPSNRRRNPAPQYIEALETRLQRAEALLRTVLPSVDLNDPNIDTMIQQRQAGNAKDFPEEGNRGRSSDAAEQDSQLRSMITSTGQLDLDDTGHWDFHGGSSGTVFFKRMREQFGVSLGPEKSIPFLPKISRPYPAALVDSPRSSMNSPLDGGNLPNFADLPNREEARALCSGALNTACALLRFVHEPTFFHMFDRIYDVPIENYGNEENQFLPLLYVVLALGCMFDPQNGEHEQPYKIGIDNG